MIVYIGLVVFVILFALSMWGASRSFENDHNFLAGVCFACAIVFTILILVFVVGSLDYLCYNLNPEAEIAAAAETRTVYVTMLGEISSLMQQDVTASDTYMDIYDKVISFNTRVRKYERWGGTWLEGLFCDPRYEGLEIIPLN